MRNQSPDLFAQEPTAPSKAGEKEEAPPDQRPCRGCRHFTLNPEGRDVKGFALYVQGFGRCALLPARHNPSPDFGCHLSPSRFEEAP